MLLRRVLVRSVRAANGMHSRVFARGFSARNVDGDADNDSKNHDTNNGSGDDHIERGKTENIEQREQDVEGSSWLAAYCAKFFPGNRVSTPSRSAAQRYWPDPVIYGGMGAFIGIGLIVGFDTASVLENPLLLAPFGASATLVFGVPTAVFSQPKNVLLGHGMSCFIGTTSVLCLPHEIAAPAAVSCALVTMSKTKCMHPPAGGTALLAVLGHPIYESYALLLPTLAGAAALCTTAAVWNNMHPLLRYPAAKSSL